MLPLWYHADAPEEHVLEVEKLVTGIVERISVQTIEGSVAETHERSSIAPAPIQPSVDPMTELNAHFDRVVRLIEDGRLTFFLGSAIHYPSKLMAKEFYEELARL